MAVLEKLFERMDAKLDRVVSELGAMRADVAELKGSVKHLPTASMMVTTAIGAAVVVAGGVVGGVFAALRYTGHG